MNLALIRSKVSRVVGVLESLIRVCMANADSTNPMIYPKLLGTIRLNRRKFIVSGTLLEQTASTQYHGIKSSMQAISLSIPVCLSDKIENSLFKINAVTSDTSFVYFHGSGGLGKVAIHLFFD